MTKIYEQYQHNVNASSDFVNEDELPSFNPADAKVRFIAYYLPQFHAIPENDQWWGKGFTEWTNVTKALPRYVGHYQPRMPSDFGFYDLRNADVLRRQAALAKRGGIYGFCIHNYWFSGRKILETPLETLLANPDIDLRFCLNWANENWTRRWDGAEHDVLLKQKYDAGDDIAYIESILPALRDPRYIRIDGRPLIMVYRPSIVPNMRNVATNWRNHLIKAGVGDPYLVMAQAFGDKDPRPYGLDAAAGFPPHNGGFDQANQRNMLKLIDKNYRGAAVSFEDVMRRTLENDSDEYRVFPGVCPSWDNEARKPGRGFSVFGAHPKRYGKWLRAASDRALKVPSAEERVVFINAWNEWAEGAYLEPDRHNGYAYLAETRHVLDSLGSDAAREFSASQMNRRFTTTPSYRNFLINAARSIAHKIKGRVFSL